MKLCTKCKIEKPFEDFYTKGSEGYNSWCKACCRENVRKHYAERPDYYHDKRLRREFGITLEDYQSLHRSQDGKCAICGSTESRVRKSGKREDLMVDHDHETGEIRGLLCHRCNTMLGHAQDDPGRLRKAASYLSR